MKLISNEIVNEIYGTDRQFGPSFITHMIFAFNLYSYLMKSFAQNEKNL